jgi:hypothetical protein
MWSCTDSQEVGLEAATLERVRNSSLVEWFRADNVAGLSEVPKLRDRAFARSVGERCNSCEGVL